MEEPRFRQGAGRVCLDLTRTLRRRGSDVQLDELPDGAALGAWLGQLLPPVDGIVSAPAPVPDAAPARTARRLREAIYELVVAAMGAGIDSCRTSARERVNRAAVAPVPTPRLLASGQIRWYAEDPVAASLALVARDALDLVSSSAIHRVRACCADSCAALFLDASRPGSRRWCSMNGCGNHAKKAALRDRAAR